MVLIHTSDRYWRHPAHIFLVIMRKNPHMRSIVFCRIECLVEAFFVRSWRINTLGLIHSKLLALEFFRGLQLRLLEDGPQLVFLEAHLVQSHFQGLLIMTTVLYFRQCAFMSVLELFCLLPLASEPRNPVVNHFICVV